MIYVHVKFEKEKKLNQRTMRLFGILLWISHSETGTQYEKRID